MLKKTIKYQSLAAITLLVAMNSSVLKGDDAMTWTASSTNSHCQGYYQQTLLGELWQPVMSVSQGRTEITADSVEVTYSGESVMSGNVIVTQPGRRLTADNAVIYRDSKQGKFTYAQLSGFVTLQEAGKVINAESAYIDLLTSQARLDNADLRFASAPALDAALARLYDAGQTQAKQTLHIEGITARASAKQISQPTEDIFLLTDAGYTTCPPGQEAWRLQAKKLKLNRQTGLGTASHVTLKLHDIPVFYWPYLLFPIDNSRRSGLLLPIVSLSQSGGVDYAQPFYWDIAPNYDFLFTPRVMQKRGVLWQGQFRYLNDTVLGVHEGRLRGGWIGHDSDFNNFRDQEFAELTANSVHPPEIDRLLNASAKRHYINWDHTSDVTDNITWQTLFHHVSDDYVLQDFGRLGLPSIENQLPEQSWLTYEDEHWRGVIEYSKYQTLHPVNKPKVREQYRRQPRLALDGFYPNLFAGVSGHFSSEYVDFDRKQNPGELTLPEVGSRLHLQPGLSYPLQYGLAGYITPRVDFWLTHYELNHIPEPRHEDLTRSLPVMSVDAGLFLEKSISLFGRKYTSTLEPRLYYLYVPNKDQDGYPLFDTTQNMFTYEQLFRDNRFSGLDRLGDANQLTVALSTRLTNAVGVERARFSTGAIVYFRDRDVALCQQSGAACIDKRSLIVKESLSDTSTISPIISESIINLFPRWRMKTVTAWDEDKSRLANGSFSLQYHEHSQKFIRAGLSYLRGGDVLQSVSSSVTDGRDLKQFDTSFVWPLTDRWHLLGRYHYNLSHEYTQDYIAGVEYESCCWVLRLVAGRTFKGLNTEHHLQYNRAIYLQWQMKGLATVGSSHPSHYLTEQIPGYNDTFLSGFPRFV